MPIQTLTFLFLLLPHNNYTVVYNESYDVFMKCSFSSTETKAFIFLYINISLLLDWMLEFKTERNATYDKSILLDFWISK